MIYSLKTSSRSNKYSSEFPFFLSDVKNQGTVLEMSLIKTELDIMRFRHNEVNFEAHFMIVKKISKCSYLKYVFE